MVRLKRKKEKSKAWIRKGKRLIRLEDIETQSEERQEQFSNPACNKISKRRCLSLLELPDECILMIFEKLNLDPHDLYKLMTVCKRFLDVSSRPRLWRNADFRLTRYIRRFDLKSSNMGIVKRRKMYAQYLAQRRTRLSHLILHCDIYRDFRTFSDMVQCCCSKELKYVELKWALGYYYAQHRARKTATLRFFRELFTQLSVCSPNINFLKLQLDGSCASSEMVGKLKNIQHLEVHFIDRVGDTLWWHSPNYGNILRPLEIILRSLPKLKVLKVKMRTSIDDVFDGYVLKSESLEHLDYTYSKGLRIKELYLPNLHTFIAENVFNFRQGIGSPCLFEMIERGCPYLTTFNDMHSNISGLQNFPLTDNDKIDLRLCECDKHNFIRNR